MRVSKVGVQKVSLALLMMAASVGAMAAGEVEAGIIEAQTTVAGYIGLAIAAGFVLLGLSLSADVGMGLVKKWVKKGAK